MNLHVGIDTLGGISNPIDSTEKESKFCDVKFGYDDDEHIYDDPNIILDGKASGRPELPQPYCKANGGQEKPQLSSAASCSGDKRKGRDLPLEPRYAFLDYNKQEKQEQKPTLSSVPPPHSTFLPPGYAAPKSLPHNTPTLEEDTSSNYDDCLPSSPTQGIPSYDDCVPKPSASNYYNYKPESQSQPQDPPSSEGCDKSTNQSPTQAELPPGYASPRALGFLASEAEPEKKLFEEEEITSSSFKPQSEPEKVDLTGDQPVYFPLRSKSIVEEGAYQDVSAVMSGGVSGSGEGKGEAASTLQEDDQYVVMKTPLAKTAPKVFQ